MQVVVFVVGFHHSHWVITSGAYFLSSGLAATDCIGRDEIRIAHGPNRSLMVFLQTNIPSQRL